MTPCWDVNLPIREGDQVIVLLGEHQGTVGEALAYHSDTASWTVRQESRVRPRAWTRVQHGAEYLARVVTEERPPKFASVKEADAWMEQQRLRKERGSWLLARNSASKRVTTKGGPREATQRPLNPTGLVV